MNVVYIPSQTRFVFYSKDLKEMVEEKAKEYGYKGKGQIEFCRDPKGDFYIVIMEEE